MDEWMDQNLFGRKANLQLKRFILKFASISQIFMSCILETALWLGPSFAGKTQQHLLVLTPTLSVRLSKNFGICFNVNLNLLVLEEPSSHG